jgi:A/G-specific adenine glycosylase
MSQAKVKTLLPTPRASTLLRWYDRHRRALPWRAPAGVMPDPYAVWLSEIMLQQTTVAAVIPYYQAFITRWPTVQALAAARLDDVLAAWAGLGYYRRARNLHLCAQHITLQHDGVFPAEAKSLLALPGIGAYTAAALQSIAFERQATVVDGNVERIMARLYEIPQPVAQAKAVVRAHATALLPQARHGDYAQALMDLGATICRPQQPVCSACPWQKNCGAAQHGTTTQFPVPLPRRQRPVRRAVAFYWENPAGEIWLRQRPLTGSEGGLLGGMLELPASPWLEQAAMPALSTILPMAPGAAHWHTVPTPVRHIFTHFELYIQLMYGKAITMNTPSNGFWVAPAALPKLAIPSLTQKLIVAVKQWRDA